MTNSSPSLNLNGYLTKIDQFLTKYLVNQAPEIPASAKESIVKYSPYLTLLLILISFPAILTALGIGAMFAPVAYMGGIRTGFSFSFGWLTLLASIILEILAVKGLFKRQLSAWKLVYYATLLNGLYNLFRFDLGGLIIGTGISLYILYQVKSYYK